jgi:hypothetical protein
MAIKKYNSLHTTAISIRNDEVQAIRVSDINYEGVAEWLGERGKAVSSIKKGEEVNRRVRVKTPKGWRVAKVGDFVVKNNEGKYFVGKDDVFEAQFVRIP